MVYTTVLLPMVLMSQRAVYILLVLISALFYTLFERKLLGASHLRLGPTLVRVYGALQPLADVLKLFLKGQVGKEGNRHLTPVKLIQTATLQRSKSLRRENANVEPVKVAGVN